MKKQISKSLQFIPAALSLAFCLLANHARAASLYFDPTGANALVSGSTYTWDTTSSEWATSSALSGSPGVWATADTAVFTAGPSAGTITVDVNTANLACAGLYNGGTGSANPCNLTIATTGSGSLSFSSSTLYTFSGYTTMINVPISGSGTITTGGAGTTILNASGSTSTGGTTLSAGTGSILEVGSASSLGSGTINFNTSQTDFQAYGGANTTITFANALTLGASGTQPGINEIFGAPNTANLTFTGNANSGTTTSKTIEANGITLTFSGVISGATTSQTLGWAGINGGVIVLSGANTYTKPNILTSGTVQVDSIETVGTSGPLGKSAASNPGNIVFSGGTLQYSSVNNNDYSGRFSTAANQAYNIDVNGRNVSFGTALTSSGGALTLSDSYGGGSLMLNALSTYSGATTINGGTLQLGAANAIASSSTVNMNGGTLNGGGFNHANNGTLGLTASSTILFGGGNMSFADSHTLSWSGVLNLSDWVDPGSTYGGTQLEIGTSSSGLTSSQLADIEFDGNAATLGDAAIDSNGFIYDAVAVPEPSSALLGLLGVLWNMRRRTA